MPKMAIPLAQVSGSTPQKMYDAQKKQPIAVMARTWRSDGCAPRPVLGRAAGRAGFRTVLQVMGLSLRARSASGSGGSRGTDKESGFLSRKRHFRVALSCDTLGRKPRHDLQMPPRAKQRHKDVAPPRRGASLWRFYPRIRLSANHNHRKMCNTPAVLPSVRCPAQKTTPAPQSLGTTAHTHSTRH